jgi:hypothetical protein
MALVDIGIQPGTFLVDTLPICEFDAHVPIVVISDVLKYQNVGLRLIYHPLVRYVPSWFPGASWKRLAVGWAADFRRFLDNPVDIVKKELVRTFVFLISYLTSRTPSSIYTLISSLLAFILPGEYAH